ncbi:GNAT family N-acetyltransferase [Anaerorhabdus sp.]|uniref:GNAT family N-acetyltransferase n=1 Tax=Anaerorhabdus sp. TaxID=1872524 RepID=UPI002FC7F546
MYIQTKRCIVRDFEYNDSDDFFEFLSDEETCLNDGGYLPFKEKDELFDAIMVKQSQDSGRFVVEVKEIGKVIGAIHLMEVDGNNEMLEIGYIFNPNYVGYGYAGETVSAVIDYFFNEMNINKFDAGVFPFNIKSKQLLKKLGFIYDHLEKDACKHEKLGMCDFEHYIKVKNNVFVFEKLTQRNALIIADEWKYDGDYAFYDISADIEDYNEFINEEQRNKNDMFQVFLEGELVGFFCLMRNDNEIEIGLGLKPSLCGKGLGKVFITEIEAFLMPRYKYDTLVMNVAKFNERAIKSYFSCGYVTTKVYKNYTNGKDYDFLEMKKIVNF